MRRKTFWNNIKNIYSNNISLFEEACQKLQINKEIRPEDLSLEQLIFFYKFIKK